MTDPDISALYDLSGTSVLDAKTRELILLSVNVSTTHLYQPAIRKHIDAALKHGATREEIVEVFQLTTALGLHTWTIGAPLLMEALKTAGKSAPDTPLTERQERLKAQFIAENGGWSDYWNSILVLSPDAFEAALQIIGLPWKTGPLAPKVKELIYVAIDAATTHLYQQGLRIHIHKAMKHGASKEEIVETLRLVSSLGEQTLEIGLPMLADALKRKG